MRLGLVGPAGGDQLALENALRFLFKDLSVERAVYLGVDTALDEVVQRWASELVGGDPGERALYRRAAERCVDATPAEIGLFLEVERERQALKVFESLPGDGTRVIELMCGKVLVMIYDKSDLDEEDIVAATFLVFGKSREPVVKRVGSRWFLSPGELKDGGIMLLEDGEEGVLLKRFDTEGREIESERLVVERKARLRVGGTPN
jgi:hypothetical protein